MGALAQQAPERVAQRNKSGLTALRLAVGQVVSALCAVCGSYGGLVVRHPLLSNWEVAGCARHAFWVSCLVPSVRCILVLSLGKFCVLSLVHVHQGPFLSRFAQVPFGQPSHAVVPLRALRETGGALVHRPVPHIVRRGPLARTCFAGSMLAAQA